MLLKVLGIPLALLGLATFAAPLALLESVTVRRELRNVRLPLGDTAGLVQAEECGVFYHGSCFYRQLQVYDLEGHFLRSWFVDGDGGDFVMERGEGCGLVVKTARNRLRLVFDEHGTEIGRDALPGALSREGETGRFASGGEGRVYRVERSRLGAKRIVREVASGERRVLVETRLAEWLVTGG